MNSPVSSGRSSRRRLRFALPCLALIFVAGCASTPIPTANMEAAKQAIANAERVDAATHAATELAEARAKLTFAQHAVDEEDMLMAGQFADQARASAELAAARSDAAKANAVNKDMKQSTATLVDEMQRKTGESR